MRRVFLIVLCMALLFLSGCGKRASADKLVREAKNKHGDLEVISKNETSDRVEVIVKDEAQGFEYKLSSKMDEVYIDGSSFGSVPSVADSFYVELGKYTMNQVQAELDSICKKYDIEYEMLNVFEEKTPGLLKLTIPMSVSEEVGIKASEEVAELIQQYNVNNRLDGFQISLLHDKEWFKANYGTYKGSGKNAYPDETYSSSGMHTACEIGIVLLPGCEFKK